MITMMGINILLWVMPYVLLTGRTGWEKAQLHDLAQMFFNAHATGVFVWQLFFGAHLLALGYLTLKSNVVPKPLGRGLFIGAFGYLLQGIVELTFTDVVALEYTYIGLLAIVTISEIGFGIWLLLRGGR